MKESEAWRILAEEHDAKRTTSQFLCIALKDAVVCHNAMLASIPKNLRSRMTERVRSALGDLFVAYGQSESRAPDVRDARVLACLMFSEQAKEEAR